MTENQNKKSLKTENLKEYHRKYYHENRSKILSKKFCCDCCKKSVTMSNKTKHVNSEKHKRNQELQKLKLLEQELRKLTGQVVAQ